MVRLYLEDDAGNVRIMPMEADEVSIGRAEDNKIVLPDRNVSRHHARLRAVNGRFFVEDAGARYGLFLNGSRVDGRREVRPGDLIAIGDYKLEILPGEGGAEVEEARPAPDRRETVPAIPAMAEPEAGGEPSSDTSVLSLRDMEQVARQGWPSDFEGRDEVAQKKSLTRRLIVLGVLVAVAVLLVWAYLWVTQPTEVETSSVPPGRVAEGTPAPEPAEPVAPAPQPAPPPEPVATEAEPPATAARTQGSLVAPPPSPARSFREAEEAIERPEPPKEPPRVATAEPKATTRPTPASPATQSAPRSLVPPARPARTETVPPRPASAPTGDVMEAVEEAINGGRLKEAEGLLARCRGGSCWKGWKKLGLAYQERSKYPTAISMYEKAQSLVSDGREKTRLQSMIDSLK